jgi:hypothetical protein
MKARPTSFHIERDHEVGPPTTGLSDEAVAAVVRDLQGERDATVMVSREGLDDRLMVAVSDDRVFLGLERPDGLFQFAEANNVSEGTQSFIIGGQEAEIEKRFLVSVDTAVAVVREWLDRGEDSSIGRWERQ